MAGVMPNVSGGVSPFSMANAFAQQQNALAGTLAEQARRAAASRQEAISTDTEALAGVNEALINQFGDITGYLGPTAAASLARGDLARSVLTGSNPRLDFGTAAQNTAASLQQQQADELRTRMDAAQMGLQAGVRPTVESTVQATGVPMESIPIADAMNARFRGRGDDQQYLVQLPGGQIVSVSGKDAANIAAIGQSQLVGPAPSQQQPIPQGTTTTPDQGPQPTQPSAQPAPAQPVPTGGAGVTSSEFGDVPSAQEVLNPDQAAAPQSSQTPEVPMDHRPDLERLLAHPTIASIEMIPNRPGVYAVVGVDGVRRFGDIDDIRRMLGTGNG